ncbi:MAG TPA: hypothetical protein DEF18_06610 [Muricauda sp.]|uniref:Uncharacterized protein n=1 Tax=Flagellimonas aurea TaxID=2915619 RepID=A0ABS3G3D4_9FLAO|nr:hypothetical protein [Allomuricauda aurea]MAO17132.1 hypothetical protein [Allomuricauda sp.]MBC70998.1 hypothetical protein [Allomuricauda sp.]MBO0353924.1 hypothetical protein [Allomuricauda aurea]HBU77757.1 hypothetical protein [Allomuricauda sp.]|tara:strand:- start:298 stop:900 length:603 start_codon:yes stop_codon:yes gene_type:complete
MSEFFKAELKDRFLEYALERSDYFQIYTLYDEFLRPNYSLEYVQQLVREILAYDSTLLDVMGGNGLDMFMLASTSSTEDFLEEGGFMNLYVKEEEKWDTFLGQLSGMPKLTKEEKKQIKKATPDLKREKLMLMGLILAVAVSFLFTLISIFNETLLKPEYVPADEFERRMEQLREQYILENQKLQVDLREAQHVLDSLQE